jgi:hypothetical protein
VLVRIQVVCELSCKGYLCVSERSSLPVSVCAHVCVCVCVCVCVRARARVCMRACVMTEVVSEWL